MPGRLIPLVEGQVYHVFNRGIDRRTTFSGKREFSRAYQSLAFYRFSSPPIRLSYFLAQGPDRRDEIMKRMANGEKLVEILAYCLMLNHFHLILRQTVESGIARFLSNFQNSSTRYFNTKHQRTGSLFLDQFKAVRIETDEQLLHVVRYVHLNPYSSYVVKTFEESEDYQWSSFCEYLGKKDGFCETETIMARFKTKEAYRKFVFDRVDYQRKLESIKHLIIEESQNP